MKLLTPRSCRCRGPSGAVPEGPLPSIPRSHFTDGCGRTCAVQTAVRQHCVATQGWSSKTNTGPWPPAGERPWASTAQGSQAAGRPGGYVGPALRWEPVQHPASPTLLAFAASLPLMHELPRTPNRPAGSPRGDAVDQQLGYQDHDEVLPNCTAVPNLACLLTPQWMQTSPRRNELQRSRFESIRPRSRPSWRGVRPSALASALCLRHRSLGTEAQQWVLA